MVIERRRKPPSALSFLIEVLWRCFTISKKEMPINEEIREKEIRVIGPDGAALGIMSSKEALQIAQRENLDLVNITVVALSQLSRPEGGKPKPPTLASLRSSGQIEQDADVVMFIFREEPGLLRSRRILRVAKNKEGETGQIPLVFRGETQTFRPDSVGIMLPRTKEEPQYKQMEFGALEDPGEDTPEEFTKN